MEKLKDKKVLSIIVVAVLLVVVVGGTYAFFMAQNAGKEQISTSVTTGTGDASTFIVDGNLNITANDTNFGADAGDKSSVMASGRVVFKAATGNEDGSDLCYTVRVVIDDNNFNYSNSESYPELVLQGRYTTASSSATTVTNIEDNSLHEYSHDIGDISYVTIPAAAANATTGYAGRLTAISGYDVTTNTTSFYIPYADGNNIYKIHAAAGETIEQDWVFKLNFINYDWDQSDITNPNNNNNKTFEGRVQFERVTCPISASDISFTSSKTSANSVGSALDELYTLLG